jgi:hypothetical protein
VIDRPALSDVVQRYAARVDDRRFDSIAALFTDEAVLIVPEPPAVLEPIHEHRGTAAIVTAVSAVSSAIRTQHALVGEVYDDGPRSGTARGRIACVAHHWNQRGDEVVDAAWHLRYDDEYELTDSGWRISRRALTINAIDVRRMRRVRPHPPG